MDEKSQTRFEFTFNRALSHDEIEKALSSLFNVEKLPSGLTATLKVVNTNSYTKGGDLPKK